MKGYTLLELILVLSIGLVGTSLSIGALTKEQANQQLERKQITKIENILKEKIISSGLSNNEVTIDANYLRKNTNQVSLSLNSKDDNLTFYSSTSCSPASIQLNFCFLTLSLRCRIKKYC